MQDMSLHTIRNLYRAAFIKDGIPVSQIEESISDKMLDVTGHVFIGRNQGRFLQITINNDSLPTAFLKSIGSEENYYLVQIVANETDLNATECANIVREWLVDLGAIDAVTERLRNFSAQV